VFVALMWGFAVEQACNGSEAMDKARRTPPQLILMDLWMPVLDGLEATKRLKADRKTAHIPILALSAQDLQPSASMVRAAGADVFIVKPSEPELLLTQIRAVMGRSRVV